MISDPMSKATYVNYKIASLTSPCYHGGPFWVSMQLFISPSLVLTKAAWALVSVTVSDLGAIMIARTMTVVVL